MVLTMMVLAAGLTFNPAEPAAMRLEQPMVEPAGRGLIHPVAATKPKRTKKKAHVTRRTTHSTTKRS